MDINTNKSNFVVIINGENQWKILAKDKYKSSIGYIRHKPTGELGLGTDGMPVYKYYSYPLGPFKSNKFHKFEDAVDYVVECYHRGHKRRKEIIVAEYYDLPVEVDKLRLLLDSIVTEHCGYFDLKVATNGNKWTIHGSRWETDNEYRERIESYGNTESSKTEVTENKETSID